MCVCSIAQSCLTLCDPKGLYPDSLICPWDFPGNFPGVGSHFLLQEIFTTQGLNPHLLHLLLRQAGSLPLSHLKSPGKVAKLMGFPQRGGLMGRDVTHIEATTLSTARASISKTARAGCSELKALHRAFQSVVLFVPLSSPFFPMASRTRGLTQVGVTGTLLLTCHHLHGTALPTRRRFLQPLHK